MIKAILYRLYCPDTEDENWTCTIKNLDGENYNLDRYDFDGAEKKEELQKLLKHAISKSVTVTFDMVNHLISITC